MDVNWDQCGASRLNRIKLKWKWIDKNVWKLAPNVVDFGLKPLKLEFIENENKAISQHASSIRWMNFNMDHYTSFLSTSHRLSPSPLSSNSFNLPLCFLSFRNLAHWVPFRLSSPATQFYTQFCRGATVDVHHRCCIACAERFDSDRWRVRKLFCLRYPNTHSHGCLASIHIRNDRIHTVASGSLLYTPHGFRIATESPNGTIISAHRTIQSFSSFLFRFLFRSDIAAA